MFLDLSVRLSQKVMDGFWRGWNGPMTKWQFVDFGGNPDHESGSWNFLKDVYVADCIKSALFARWQYLSWLKFMLSQRFSLLLPFFVACICLF